MFILLLSRDVNIAIKKRKAIRGSGQLRGLLEMLKVVSTVGESRQQVARNKKPALSAGIFILHNPY